MKLGFNKRYVRDFRDRCKWGYLMAYLITSSVLLVLGYTYFKRTMTENYIVIVKKECGCQKTSCYIYSGYHYGPYETKAAAEARCAVLKEKCIELDGWYCWVEKLNGYDIDGILDEERERQKTREQMSLSDSD